MIRLSEFESIVREFAISQDLDLADASLFEATVKAVAMALEDNGYELSIATKKFVECVDYLDTILQKTLHKSTTLRIAYQAI